MKNKSNRNIIILLGILGVSLVFSYMSMGGSEESTDIVVDSGQVGQNALDILTKVQAVNLDLKILESLEFNYLRNIAIPLPNLPVGRANPFSPAR